MAPKLAEIGQIPGVGANWKAFQLFKPHFIWYFAYVTLFWAKIDAPFMDPYDLP